MEDTPPLRPLCPARLDKDGLGVDNEVLDADGWGLIEGRGVLNDGRGTPPKDGRGVPLSDGRGTPPNEGLGTLPNEGLGTLPKDGRGVPLNEGLGTPPNEGLGPSPPLTSTLTLRPPLHSKDPTLDALEYVLNLESEGGYFFGVRGSGGSDLSMLHDNGVDDRGGEYVWLEPITEGGSGLVSENATGLRGVAGDSEEVEVVLEPLPVPPPVPVPSPLELDPALSRKSARVGVTLSIPSSNGIGTGTRASPLGL